MRLPVRLADEICLFQQVGANDEVSRLLPTAEGRALPCCWLSLQWELGKLSSCCWLWEALGAGLGLVRLGRSTLIPNLPPKLFSTQRSLSLFPSFPLVGAACPGPSLDAFVQCLFSPKIQLTKEQDLRTIEGHPCGPALCWTRC